MTESLMYNPCVYQTPSEKVLEKRKLFYLTHKDDTESITEWLWRIKDSIIGCEFGELSDFLLIDKFICELRNDEIQNFTRIQTWQLEQLCETVEGPKFDPDICTIDTFNNQEPNINAILQCEVKMDCDFSDEQDVQDDSSDTDDDKNIFQLQKELNEKKDKQEDTGSNGKSARNSKTSQRTDVIIEPKEIKVFEIGEHQKQYKCLECGRVFNQRSSCVRHKKIHSRKDPQSCKICDKEFARPGELKKHLLTHESSDNRSYECYLCKFQFLRIQGMRIHVRVKHVTNTTNVNSCEHCGERFTHQKFLEHHFRHVHSIDIKHKCSHCNRVFDYISKLKEHLIIHSDSKPFMCEICGNAFKTNKQLHLHMARHTNERRFKCGECGQMLKSRSNYKTHMLKHTGERPFSCHFPHCTKTFVQRANYMKHLRWHTGDRPHACTFKDCNKRFPTAYDMKLHINSIHTGARPFVCQICHQSFSQPSTLRVHRLRVHQQ